MSTPADLIDALTAAVEAVPGVRPVPALTGTGWLPKTLRSSAIELGAELVEIRVVATELPLPPLADKVAAAVEPVLAGTRWAGATVRLVVAELEAAALEGDAMT